MNKVSFTGNCRKGDIVKLKRTEKSIKMGESKSYEWFVTSSFVCIREATDSQRGILVKVLGRYELDRIMMVDGRPFCKDDCYEEFESKRYSSFLFPSVVELKEVLDILSHQPELLQVFEEASMHINPRAKFWVNETTSRYLFKKQPLCYDPLTGDLASFAKDPLPPYRITVAYFSNGELQLSSE